MNRQRNPNSCRILSVRPLVESDLEALRQPSKRVGLVRSLRDSHHNVARLFALGLSNTEIAERTGYGYNRISMFRSDPAMIELIAHYREMVTESFREEADSFMTTAVANMRKAERQLSDHLDKADEADELLPVRELVAITTDRMDRFGYGKKSMNLNVNVDFAAKLEAAIARTKKVAAE